MWLLQSVFAARSLPSLWPYLGSDYRQKQRPAMSLEELVFSIPGAFLEDFHDTQSCPCHILLPATPSLHLTYSCLIEFLLLLHEMNI